MPDTPGRARTTYFFYPDRIWIEKTNPKDKNHYQESGSDGIVGQNELLYALEIGIGPCKPSIRALETILGLEHRVGLGYKKKPL